jgi:integrase
MSRKATGTILEPTKGRASWALRFTAYGKRRFVNLGTPSEGWSRAKAEEELAFILAKVKRGEWQPDDRPTIPEQSEEETFHEFSSSWLKRKEQEVKPRTAEGYRTALELHILPFFADYRLSEITRRDVDRFTEAKLKEGILSARSINQLLTRLSSILETAVDYELIPTNAAGGRRRRLKAEKPQTPHLEPEQLPALLEAAGELRLPKGYKPENLGEDGFESDYRTIARPLIATLALAGLRISEALALEWRDVDLSTRTLKVGRAKTDAGVREIDLSWALAEILAGLRADSDPKPRDPVFGMEHHRRKDRSKPSGLDRNNVAKRIIAPAITGANLILEEQGIAPIPRVTPHGLRHTFASLRFACGDDPVYVAAQLGHTDPSFSIRVYAKAVKRRGKLSGPVLEAYEKALEMAQIVTEGPEPDFAEPAAKPEKERIPALYAGG